MKPGSNKIELFRYLETLFSDLEQQKIALDASAIVAITNIKGDITYVNDKFCEISKYSREELIGQNHRIINSGTHPPEFFKSLWKTIGRGNVWSGEIKNRAKDGSYYWVATTIVPYLDDKGKPYQYVAIRFDITKQKNMEDDLKERTRQLEDFCFIVSHNLRAPLSNLLLLTSMIENTKDYDDQKELIDKLSKPVHVLNETFNELVEALQVRQDTSPELEYVSFEECFDKVMESLVAGSIMTDFKVSKNFHRAPGIMYPKKYINSYIHNLLSNAIRYRSPERPLQISVESYIKNNSIFLEVRDNGLGIDMAQHGEKLFGLRRTFHGNQDAKGFGLFITKTQVETMGGCIRAESLPNAGTTFSIQFNKH